MKRTNIALLLLLAVASHTGCTNRSDQSATADPQKPAETSDWTPCYDWAALDYAAKKGSGFEEAQKQVAERFTGVADNQFGPGVVFVTTAGDKKQHYLLLASTPKNEKSLKLFGANLVQTKSLRAKLCAADGFDEVQLIIRNDDGVNQTLVKKVVLDYHEAKQYASQTTGARPE